MKTIKFILASILATAFLAPACCAATFQIVSGAGHGNMLSQDTEVIKKLEDAFCDDNCPRAIHIAEDNSRQDNVVPLVFPRSFQIPGEPCASIVMENSSLLEEAQTYKTSMKKCVPADKAYSLAAQSIAELRKKTGPVKVLFFNGMEDNMLTVMPQEGFYAAFKKGILGEDVIDVADGKEPFSQEEFFKYKSLKTDVLIIVPWQFARKDLAAVGYQNIVVFERNTPTPEILEKVSNEIGAVVTAMLKNKEQSKAVQEKKTAIAELSKKELRAQKRAQKRASKKGVINEDM